MPPRSDEHHLFALNGGYRPRTSVPQSFLPHEDDQNTGPLQEATYPLKGIVMGVHRGFCFQICSPTLIGKLALYMDLFSIPTLRVKYCRCHLLEKIMAFWSNLLPDNLLEWRERRRAMREIDHLREKEEWILALDDANFVNRALVSARTGDVGAAEHYWEQALLHYPHFARTSHDSLEVLLKLRRFDEAEALVLEGQKRAPQEPFYACGYARVAESRGVLDEATRRWSDVRKKFPSNESGYVGGGSCLRRLGQLDEAEALLKKAIELFARDVPAWIEWARVADARRDWDEAIRRWELLYQRFRNIHGDIGVARGLTELGRLDEAEERLRSAQLRFPIDPEISVNLAQLAERRGDKDEAVRRWADTQRRFPLLPMGYQNGIRTLRELERTADAEQITLAAIDRFPAHAWPAVEYASIAHEKRDWEAAAKRWEAVRKGWPERTDGYLRGAEALTALGRLEAAAELKARVPG